MRYANSIHYDQTKSMFLPVNIAFATGKGHLVGRIRTAYDGRSWIQGLRVGI
jgi:hypothetical protein